MTVYMLQDGMSACNNTNMRNPSSLLLVPDNIITDTPIDLNKIK